jgi:hypothetical protein
MMMPGRRYQILFPVQAISKRRHLATPGEQRSRRMKPVERSDPNRSKLVAFHRLHELPPDESRLVGRKLKEKTAGSAA